MRIIKRYSNRKLYDTEDKRYITHLVMDSKTAFELNKLESERAQLATQPD